MVNTWPPVGNLWFVEETSGLGSHLWNWTIFEVKTWRGTFKWWKNEKKDYMQFRWKFCYNVFQKSSSAVKSAKLHQYWGYGHRVSFKQHSRPKQRTYFRNKGFLKSIFRAKDVILPHFQEINLREQTQPNFSESRSQSCDACIVSEWIFDFLCKNFPVVS